MRNTIVFLMLCSLAMGFAQDVEKQESRNSVAKGSRAMVFELAGLDNIGAMSYKGGFAGKYFLTNQLAIRAGIRVDRSSQTMPANPGTGLDGTDGELKQSDFGLFGLVEYHFSPRGYISPYFGGGLGVGFTSMTQKQSAIYFPGADEYRRVDETSGQFDLNISGVMGAEVFLTREISLSAEYVLSIAFTGLGEDKTSYEVVSGSPVLPPSVTDENGSVFAWNTTSAGQLILTIYF